MDIKIAIVDDHKLITRGFQNMLQEQENMRVTAIYHSGKSLLQGLAQGHLPDVLLMDIQLPDQSGNELVREVAKLYPDVRIIALTSLDTLFHVKDMMAHGCMGYVTKQAEEQVLIDAIRHVYRNEEYLEEELKARWLKSMLKSNKENATITPLSRREKEIIKLIAQEFTNQEIAEKLFLSHRTIESHRYSLLQKLGVKNTAGLVRIAVQMGLLD